MCPNSARGVFRTPLAQSKNDNASYVSPSAAKEIAGLTWSMVTDAQGQIRLETSLVIRSRAIFVRAGPANRQATRSSGRPQGLLQLLAARRRWRTACGRRGRSAT